ncbi:hypothetical protein U1Q18_024168 [Sarracenia purpurea var. burkii]
MAIVKTVTQIGDAVWSNGAEKLKEYVPDPDRRAKISQILANIGKFAVESAVSESLKGVNGAIQVYKIVKEGLKDPPPSLGPNENKKPGLSVAMEEMQAKMEKMQEEMNNIKGQNKVSIQNAKGLEPSKELPNDVPIKESAPPKTDPKRVFIRSRL